MPFYEICTKPCRHPSRSSFLTTVLASRTQRSSLLPAAVVTHAISAPFEDKIFGRSVALFRIRSGQKSADVTELEKCDEETSLPACSHRPVYNRGDNGIRHSKPSYGKNSTKPANCFQW